MAVTVFTGFAGKLCINAFVGLKECLVCAVVQSIAYLVTSIGRPVVLSATCILPASIAKLYSSVAADMCEDHVTLTELCQAVWQISKSQQTP